MHDPEKSDSGIVVMKPMNKAGRPAAELVEPRPGTKGIRITPSSAASSHPLSLESLAPAHAIEVHTGQVR